MGLTELQQQGPPPQGRQEVLYRRRATGIVLESFAGRETIEVVKHQWLDESSRAMVTLSDGHGGTIRWQDWAPLDELIGDAPQHSSEASLTGPWNQRFTKHLSVGDALQWDRVETALPNSGECARLHRMLLDFDALVEAWYPLHGVALLYCGRTSNLFGFHVTTQGMSRARLDQFFAWLRRHWSAGVVDLREQGILTLYPHGARSTSVVPGGGVEAIMIAAAHAEGGTFGARD